MTRAETLERAGQRFDRLDTNHDGKLDAAELAAARPMRGPRGGGDTPPPPAPPAQ
jgi:Ca2+-binding EF-hand superfamily protein